MVLSSRQVIGLAQQPVIGTPVTATHLLPVISCTVNEEIEPIVDNGRRGPNAMDFGSVQGVKFFDINIEGNVQGNGTTGMGMGILLRNLLECGTSAQYNVSQIGATGVYKHNRRMGSTKEYITLEENLQLSGSNARQVEGCRCRQMVFNWNAGEGAVTYTANVIGRELALIAGTDLSAQEVTQEDMFGGWRASVNVNGVDTFGRLLSAEWTLSREASRIYPGLNQQKYNDILLGPIEVTLSLVFDYVAVTDIAMFRSKTQGELINLFEYGSSGTLRGFGLGSLKTDFGDGPANIDTSGENVTLSLSGRCLYSTGNGPIGTDKGDSLAQNGPIETLTEETKTAQY